MSRGRPIRRSRSAVVLAGVAVAFLFATAGPRAALGQQSDLGKMMEKAKGSQQKEPEPPRPPAAPWTIVAGEVVLGTALSAGLGYGVGLLAESFCDDCDAGEPGGDTPGLLVGVPAGAFTAVWLLGRQAPPPGRLEDTLVGAAAGTAVFTAYTRILEKRSDLVRWSGIVLPAALAATGWNRSRRLPEPEVSWYRPPETGWGKAEPVMQLHLVALSF